MANEVHNKILIAEAALDFGTAFATLDSLPAGDLAWCAPLTEGTAPDWDDVAWAQVFAAISSGASSPTGTVEFYVGRQGTNLTQAAGFGNTLTDHGVEATAADVTAMLASLGAPVAVIPVSATDTVYTKEFKVWKPGENWQLFVYNNTTQALDGTSSPHSVYASGWGPEVQ